MGPCDAETRCDVVVIRVESLTKLYDNFTALHNVTFETTKGEIFGLVGPNGAGKTTLLKLLLGIVHPTSGRSWIDGISAQDDAVESRRRCGYLPGDGAFPDFLPAGTFLRDALDDYPSVDRVLERRLVEQFKLPLKKRIREYSHGMRRKLGIVQAVAPRTAVTILDEPEDGLDPTARLQLIELLRSLRQEGRTILFSSHHLDTVAQVCDRVAFVAGGKLIDCDTMESIRRRAEMRMRVRLAPGANHELLRVPGVAEVKVKDSEAVVVAESDPLAVLRAIVQLPIESIEYRRLRLDDLYSDLYGIERSQKESE